MEKLFFDETLKLLAEEKSSVIYQIRVDIADYWSWFKSENQTILMQRNAGLSKQFEFTIAPVLEKRNRQRKGGTGTQDEEISVQAIDKYYLLWKQFDNTTYRRKNPHTSSYIKVAKPENIINVVGKKCSGEYEKFVETEKKLAPLRQILDAIHRTEISVISEQRKYLRRFNQKNQAIEQQADMAMQMCGMAK